MIWCILRARKHEGLTWRLLSLFSLSSLLVGILAELICKELKSLNDFLLRVPDALAVPGGGEVSGSRKMLKVCGKRDLFMWQKRPIYGGEVSGARKTLKVTARTHTVVHTHTRTRACTHTHTQTIGCSQNAQDLCTHARVHTHIHHAHIRTHTQHTYPLTHIQQEKTARICLYL